MTVLSRKWLVLPLLVLNVSFLQSQNLLRDINTATNSSLFKDHIVFKGEIYFSAVTGNQLGRELYKTNRSASTIELVKDILPGEYGSNIQQFSSAAGHLFFIAENDTEPFTGQKLMISDGTEDGTQVFIEEINGQPFFPQLIGAVGELLVTVARLDDSLRLWATDQNPENLKIIQTFPRFTNIYEDIGFVSWQDLLFFTTGNTLWRTDGSAEGTLPVLNLEDQNRPDFRYLTPGLDALYFWVDDGTGISLWKTDGTAENTIDIGGIYREARVGYPRDIFTDSGNLYFTTGRNDGFQLWQTNGSAEGTQVFSEMNGLLFGTNFTFLGDKILFNGSNHDFGAELWSVQANEDPVLVKDINPDTHSNPSYLLPFNDLVYFAAEDHLSGPELWATDGTSEGTTRVTDLFPGLTGSAPVPVSILDDSFFFTATDRAHGLELWQLNANESTPKLFVDFNDNTGDSDVRFFFIKEEELYFTPNDQIHGHEPWRYDRNSGTTELVLDLNPGINGSFEGDVTNTFAFQDQLFFIANTDSLGNGIWRTDGTPGGTSLVFDTKPGPSFDAIENLEVCNDHIYFSVFRSDGGIFREEVWVSGGDSSSTRLANLSGAEEFDQGLHDFTCIDDRLFFSSVNNYLYRISGDDPETVEVIEDYANENAANLNQFSPLDNGEFLLAFDGNDNGRELWISNGEPGGTRLLADISPGEDDSNPSHFYKKDSVYYFLATGPERFRELWQTNGTLAGTRKVKTLQALRGNLFLYGFATMAEKIYFMTGKTNSQNIQLWSSDGTEAGTDVFFTVFFNRSTSVAEKRFVVLGDRLYFVGYDFEHGYELWETDGTAENTRLALDLCPGTCEGNPASYIVVDDQLYFTGYTIEHGREPWRFKPIVSSIKINDVKADQIDDLFTVYPSPLLGNQLNLKFKKPLREKAFTLFIRNLQGHVVFRKEITPQGSNLDVMLDRGLLPSGLYLVEIRGSSWMATQKLVKVN